MKHMYLIGVLMIGLVFAGCETVSPASTPPNVPQQQWPDTLVSFPNVGFSGTGLMVIEKHKQKIEYSDGRPTHTGEWIDTVNELYGSTFDDSLNTIIQFDSLLVVSCNFRAAPEGALWGLYLKDVPFSCNSDTTHITVTLQGPKAKECVRYLGAQFHTEFMTWLGHSNTYKTIKDITYSAQCTDDAVIKLNLSRRKK